MRLVVMATSMSLAWAHGEFGRAALGNELRTQRLVKLAAAAMERPAGPVTRVVKNAAEREGAFRFIENGKVRACDIARSSHEATVRRCVEDWVYVAVDQTTLSITDHNGTKGLGPVSNLSRHQKVRGAEVMSALAVSQRGATIGLVAQQWWRRSDTHCPQWNVDKRPVEERESDLWIRTMSYAMDRFADSNSRPWFQIDRGGDFWRVFEFAEENNAWVTTRSAYDRRLWDHDVGLHARLRRVRKRGSMRVTVPARRPPERPRPARRATLEIRFEPVTLEMRDNDGVVHLRDVSVVEVSERSRREDRIVWRLLTTYPVKTVADAKQVVHGYTQRWRVEDFHFAWKSGRCNVERSQLRSPQAFCRWATILAAVAARVETLKHLSRTTPDASALEHLSRAEVDAAIVLTETKKHKPGDNLTLQQAVWLIAQVGGYTGKSSGGPPGTSTISRGLQDVTAAALVIERLKT